MAEPTLQLSCKFQNPSTKAYTPGTLSLDPSRVVWTSESGALPDLFVPLPTITNQQRAKGKPFLRLVTAAKPYVFEFNSELERDGMVEAVSKAQAAQQSVTSSSAGSTGLSQHDKQIMLSQDKDVEELYNQMVKAPAGQDGDLEELYNQMVKAPAGQDGVLTEDEFWQGILSRKGGVSSKSTAEASGTGQAGSSGIIAFGKSKQRSGLGNLMVVVEVVSSANTAVASDTGQAGSSGIIAFGKSKQRSGLGNLMVVVEVVSSANTAEASGTGQAGSSGIIALGKSKQRSGLGNLMVVVEGEVDGRQSMGKGKLSVTVTPQMIIQIFAERPHVKRAFSKNVPSNMSEQEFWNRFVKHEVAKEVRRKRMLSGSSMEDVPDDFGELFSSAAYSAAEQRRQRGKAACVNPTINLAYQLDDNSALRGHGVAHDTGREADLDGGVKVANMNIACDLEANLDGGVKVANMKIAGDLEANLDGGVKVANMKIAGDLVHDINRHAEVVLGGVDAMQALAAHKPKDMPDAAGSGPYRGEGVSGRDQECRQTLDDLVDVVVVEPQVLSIANPRRAHTCFSTPEPKIVETTPPLIKPEPSHVSVPQSPQLSKPRRLIKPEPTHAARYFDRMQGGDAQPSGKTEAAPPLIKPEPTDDGLTGQHQYVGAGQQQYNGRAVHMEGVKLSGLQALCRLDSYALNLKPMSPDEACHVMYECCSGQGPPKPGARGPASETVGNVSRSPADVLPPMERLGSALNSKYEEVERMVSAALGPERVHIRQLLRPPRDMLEAALAR
eukprot:gene5256-18488_t